MNFALEALISAMSANCLAQSNCSKKIISDVVEPLDELVVELEQLRKKISVQGNSITRTLGDSVHALNKIKEKYYKTCREIEVTELQMKGIDTNSKKKTEYDKLEKKLNKLKEDCQEDEQAYRQQLSVVNATQTDFYTSSMPRVINEAQELLTKRSETLKRLFETYSNSCNSYVAELETPSKALSAAISAISVPSDLTEFCQHISTEPTIVPENFVFEPFVRVGKQEEKKGLFDKLRGKGTSTSKELKSPEKPTVSTNSIFGLPLQVVIDREKDEHPGLGIPYLIFFAAETIIKLKGEYTLGVFRQSGALAKIKQICDSVSLKDYDHFTFTPGSVHDLSSVLKQFLRQLPEPLFTPAVYDDCFSSPNVDQQEVISRLPDANQRLIKFIIRYLQRFAEPKTVERTQMNVSNLAAVFSPCLFRCPYTELNDMLRGSEQEKLFVERMIKTLDTSGALEVKLVLNEAEVGYVKPNENILPTEKIVFDQAPLLPPPSIEKKALPPPPAKLPPPSMAAGSPGGTVPSRQVHGSPTQRTMSPPPAPLVLSPGAAETEKTIPIVPPQRTMSPPPECSTSFAADGEKPMSVTNVTTHRVMSPPPTCSESSVGALDPKNMCVNSPNRRVISPPSVSSTTASASVETARASPTFPMQCTQSPGQTLLSPLLSSDATAAVQEYAAAENVCPELTETRPASAGKEAAQQLSSPPALLAPKSIPPPRASKPLAKSSMMLHCKLERPRSMLPPLPGLDITHSTSQPQLDKPEGDHSSSEIISDASVGQE